jgi:hypothetical protein
VIDFKVDSAATYHVYLRALAASGTDDSFWILMDGEPTLYNGVDVSSDWIWVETPQLYELAEGEHTLEIVLRESNTRLDQILITPSGKFPSGCADCPNIYIPGTTSSHSVDKKVPAEAERNLFLYPNPTRSHVSIGLQNTEQGILEIYSPKGSVLKSLDIRNGSVIDVSGFVGGSYLFVLKTHTMDYLASNMLIIKE